MPLDLNPTGLDFAGQLLSGYGQQAGFAPALGRALQAGSNASYNAQQRAAAEQEQRLRMAKLERGLLEYQAKAMEAAAARAEKLREKKDRAELREQVPAGLQELYDVDPERALSMVPAFADPSKRYVTVGNQVIDRLAPGAPAMAYEVPEEQKPTALQQNLAASGLQPGTPEFEQAMLQAINKPQVQIDQGPKLPTGYTFVDPDNPAAGVAPLPGGPADPANATTEQRNKRANAEKTHRVLTGQIADYAKALRGGIPVTGKGRDKIATQREQIKLQLKNLYELGAITGPDEEILDRLLIDPLDRTSQLAGAVGLNEPLNERAIANLEVLMQEADRGLQAVAGTEQPGIESMSTEELLRLYQEMQ